MAFWNHFRPRDVSNKQYISKIHEIVSTSLPETSDEEKMIITSIAGLMARVAYVDLHFGLNELISIKKILAELTHLDEIKIQTILKLISEETQELAGINNHLYTSKLCELLNEVKRYEVLETLFFIAGSDDSVTDIESEDIRLIAKGLNLTPKHFLAARATVVNKIRALKI